MAFQKPKRVLVGSKPGASPEDMDTQIMGEFTRIIQEIPGHDFFIGIELILDEPGCQATLSKSGHTVVKINLQTGKHLPLTPNEFAGLSTKINVVIIDRDQSARIFISAIEIPKETGYALTIAQDEKSESYRGIVCKNWNDGFKNFLEILTPMRISTGTS